MTRAKIIEIVRSVSTKSIHFGMDLGSGANISEATDEIIKVFESRTCENCKHSSMKDIVPNDDGVIACDLSHGETSTYPGICGIATKSFGCNKWKLKND